MSSAAKRVHFTALAAGVIVGGSLLVPRLVTETEPNDSTASANPVTYGDTIRGTISRGTDVDHFAIDLAAGAIVDVRLEAREAERLRLSFSWAGAGPAQLALGKERLLGWAPETRRYWITVHHALQRDLPNNDYTLAIRRPPANWVFETEPNDDPSAANQLATRDTVVGIMGPADTRDFYEVRLPPGSWIELEVAPFNLWGKVADLEVLRDDGSVARHSGGRLRAPLGPSGRALVRLESAGFGSSWWLTESGYRLVVRSAWQPPPSWLLETEQNDAFGSADPAAPGDTILGTIDRAGDADHFRLDLEAGTWLDLNLLPDSGFSGFKGRARLLTADGTELDPPYADKFRIPTSGSYFVTVSGDDVAGGPSYWYALALEPWRLPTGWVVESDLDPSFSDTVAIGQTIIGVLPDAAPPMSDADTFWGPIEANTALHVRGIEHLYSALLWDAGGTVVARNCWGGWPPCADHDLRYTVAEAGIYMLRISHFPPTATRT